MASTDSSKGPLTSHLLSLDKQAYEAATRAPFLKAAGQGRLNRKTLGKWLANDRLYTHAYLKAAGRVLASIDLPQITTTATIAAAATATATNLPAADHRDTTPQLADWLCETLVALRREDRLFIDVAKRYDIPIDLEVEAAPAGANAGTPRVRQEAKIPGLIMFERLFGSLAVPMMKTTTTTTTTTTSSYSSSLIDDKESSSSSSSSSPSSSPVLLLPWLEAAVVFWGTEQVYSDAWSWANTCQQQQQQQQQEHQRIEDADGGALRKELIPNWSSEEFVAFVGKLGGILDGAVAGLVEAHGEGVRAGLIGRAEKVWRELVAAEEAFWPKVDELQDAMDD